jgi:hypothetical protein
LVSGRWTRKVLAAEEQRDVTCSSLWEALQRRGCQQGQYRVMMRAVGVLYGSHAKTASEFSMRHSHAATAFTWSTTWLSTYWRKRIAAAVTATNAVFIGRILNADAAAACQIKNYSPNT